MNNNKGKTMKLLKKNNSNNNSQYELKYKSVASAETVGYMLCKLYDKNPEDVTEIVLKPGCLPVFKSEWL